MADQDIDLTYNFPQRKSSLGFEIYRGHGFLNGVLHSGPRVGKTTFPIAQVATIAGLVVSVMNGRKKTAEIKKLKNEQEKWQIVLDIISEEEMQNPSYVTKSVMLSRDAFTLRQAKRWVGSHGFVVTDPAQSMNYYTFPQMDPAYCSEKTVVFDEPPLGPDVKLVRSVPRGFQI